MNKTLADILRSYIPDGDGYNSEYAHNLNAAADALELQQSAPANYVMVPKKLLERACELTYMVAHGEHHYGVDAHSIDGLLCALLAAAPKVVRDGR